MNTPLNDTTQQKARDLARKITVAHDLDPELQEELCGHIEDKQLAYKNGEERQTVGISLRISRREARQRGLTFQVDARHDPGPCRHFTPV